MSTALERLLAEAIPIKPEPANPSGVWTQQEQDRHWNALCHAVGTPDAQRPNPTENEPHTGTQAA